MADQTDPLTIKICGIRTLDMLEATIDAGADMVGFMHFVRSPRHVTIEELGDLISAARGRIETCVVLVNPDNSCVAWKVAALSPDWIQLHGPETPHRVEAIRDEAGIAIIKAVGIGSADDVAHVADFVDVADMHAARCQAAQGRRPHRGHGVPASTGACSRRLTPAFLHAFRGPHARDRRRCNPGRPTDGRRCIVGRRNRTRRQETRP
jgi:phosphoribosylanthranilate isomerase